MDQFDIWKEKKALYVITGNESEVQFAAVHCLIKFR